MKILFITSRLPYPPDRGDRVRVFNFLRQISKKHDVTLISFISDPSERKHLEALQAYCRKISVLLMPPSRSAFSVLLNFWRPEPLQALYYRNSAMERLVNHTLDSNHFDVIYVHLFRMAPYVTGHHGLYRIVDLTDVISNEVKLSLPYRGLASRILYSVERPRIERYEHWLADHFEEAWLTSSADKEFLEMTCPHANIRLVTNGVDTARFHPHPSNLQETSLIFVGHLGVFHNIDAAIYLAQEILPRVQSQIPDCTLRIVGADPDPRVMNLSTNPSITVPGFIPDLNTELNRASLFVAPLRFAAGVQNKVLEAMAASLPVITTSLVNLGLGAKDDQEIVLADDPDRMGARIIELLQNAAMRESIGLAGREFVARTFRWENVLQRIGEIEQAIFNT